MNEHYIVTIDRGRLRIYAEAKNPGQRAARLEVVEAMDFPDFLTAGDKGDDDQAPSTAGLKRAIAGFGVAAAGPQHRREARRNTDILAEELDTFLQNRPGATWDLAAAPSLYQEIIEKLSPETRRRVKQSLSKTVGNQRTEDVWAFFAAAPG